VGAERDVLRAKVQLLANLVYRSPSKAEIDHAVVEAEQAVRCLEELGDDVGLAEAAVALDYLETMRGRLARAGEWALRALRYGLATGRIREATQGAADSVGFAVLGPTPFPSVGAMAEDVLLTLGGPMADSAGHALLAVASLAAGDEAGSLEHERRWHEIIDRNGLGWLGATQSIPFAIVETWCGNADRAERRLREAREALVALGDVWWVETLDAELCDAVGAQGRPQEFLRLVDTFDASISVPDAGVQARRSLLRSRAFLLRGAAADAEAAARHGLEIAGTTDNVLYQAGASSMLADVLEARGLAAEAADARAVAIERLRAKGHLAAVAVLQH